MCLFIDWSIQEIPLVYELNFKKIQRCKRRIKCDDGRLPSSFNFRKSWFMVYGDRLRFEKKKWHTKFQLSHSTRSPQKHCYRLNCALLKVDVQKNLQRWKSKRTKSEATALCDTLSLSTFRGTGVVSNYALEQQRVVKQGMKFRFWRHDGLHATDELSRSATFFSNLCFTTTCWTMLHSLAFSTGSGHFSSLYTGRDVKRGAGHVLHNRDIKIIRCSIFKFDNKQLRNQTYGTGEDHLPSAVQDYWELDKIGKYRSTCKYKEMRFEFKKKISWQSAKSQESKAYNFETAELIWRKVRCWRFFKTRQKTNDLLYFFLHKKNTEISDDTLPRKKLHRP